jgi:transposase InsO family protein
MKFIVALGEEGDTMAALCREYGISRKTGYKWQKRYEEGGATALAEQSRARLQQASAITEPVRNAVLDARSKHRYWGPRTLRRWLQNRQPEIQWPAASTIGDILQRAGLNAPRGKRQWVAPTPGKLQTPESSNHVWCADFKGQFDCQDGNRCDPLTITDAYSRYLLRCQVMSGIDGNITKAWFEAVFREYGMPAIMRTDNGTPFASVALAGLSELSIWWIKLGIRPERITPGKPQQNGRHERMHRTLKQCTAQPPAKTLRQQQNRFDAFRREYNEERPHQALEMNTPGSLYTKSPRAYPKRVRSPEYGTDRVVRTVGDCGRIHWSGERIFISKTLHQEPIGMEATEDGIWRLWFGAYQIGWLDERTMQASDTDKPPKRRSEKSAVEMPVCDADLGKR